MSQSGPSSSDSMTSSQWMILLTLGMVQFTNVLDFVIMMPLAPQFHDQWKLTAHEFGLLVSTYAYAAAFSGLMSSWFIDKVDRKSALLGLYLLFAIANFLCAEAPTYVMMLIARALAGISGGILGGVVMAIVGDIIPYSRRGLATGVIMSSFSVASIVGIPFGLFIAEQYNWRYTFFLLSVVSFILLIVAWWLLPNIRGHMVKRERQAPWHTAWTILKEANHRRAFALMAVLVMTTFMIVPYMPSYLVGNVGLEKKSIKWIYLFGGLGSLFTMALIGRLADRYGKLRVFQVLAFVTMFPLLAVTNLPPAPLYVVIIITTLMMIFTAGRTVPAMAMATACTTNERRGGFMSMMGAIQQLAMGLATTVGGFILGVQAIPEQPGLIADNFTAIERLNGYPIVGWLAAGLSLLSVYLGSQLYNVEKKATVNPEPTVAVEMA